MKAHGEEVGFKFSLLDGALKGDVTAYSYDFDNLQVQSARVVEVAPGVDTVLYTITNAADAYTRGVEAQGVWRTPVTGLVLNGFLSYNDARYKNYKDAPCYPGQTAALGCFTIPGTATSATDLSNRTLPNSPTWSGRVGAAYDWKLGHGLSMGLTFDANYQSSVYLAQPASVYVNDPAHGVEAQRRGELWLMNASARLYTENWELALIGRNIANTIYPTSLTTALGAPSPDQLIGTIGDPLLVTLQFTYHFH
jgi:iron complex outermembrane recepter protein